MSSGTFQNLSELAVSLSHDNHVTTSDFVYQPLLKGYRNKCEFTIGRCLSSGETVVGFRLGSYEEGIFDVVSAKTCCHIPARTKELAEVGVANNNNIILHMLNVLCAVVSRLSPSVSLIPLQLRDRGRVGEMCACVYMCV